MYYNHIARYILCIFTAELSLAATSSSTVVDVPFELTHSITKLSVGVSSAHTGHGSTNDSLTKVSEFVARNLLKTPAM